jgi:hypothetical protein
VSAACWSIGVTAIVAAVAHGWASGASGTIGALVTVVGACLLCALHGLARLATEDDPIAEQVVIGAVAMSGRGLCIAVLAALIMVDAGYSDTAQVVVLAAVGIVFVVAYAATLAARDRVTALRPY